MLRSDFALYARIRRRKAHSFMEYLALYRQRRALADMEPTQLEDLGLTRTEAQTEAARPFWDAPSHWR